MNNERRTLLALALAVCVFVFFSAMQAKFMPRRPAPVADTSHVVTPAPGAPAPSSTAALAPASAGDSARAVAAAPAARESLTVVETPHWRAVFSSRGARMQSFELRRYAAAHGASEYDSHPNLRPAPGHDVPAGDRVSLAGEPTFALDFGSGAAMHSLANTDFAVRESLDASGAVRALTYETTDPAGAYVRETWRIDPESYLVDLEVETRGLQRAWKLGDYSLTLRSWGLMNEANVQNDVRGVNAISMVGKDVHRDAAVSLGSAGGGIGGFFSGLFGRRDTAHAGPRVREGVVHWAGVQSHYFLALVAGVPSESKASIAAGEPRELHQPAPGSPARDTTVRVTQAASTLVMTAPPSDAGVRRFVAYLGPADYFAIAKIGKTWQLEKAVDIGKILWPVSRILLWLLRAINLVVHNYGITIVLLATLVRLVLHPVNVSSLKSMRAMQKLQPEMERIRQKYKDDPQAQNKATMELYSANKVSPLGGCLPTLVQMPLFFAMYRVIYNAVDLRQASFVGWIHDLSAPDQLLSVGGFPVRLLPLLMAGTGLLSQRLTPTDPRQATNMYMMNVVMLVFFYNLPAGLVLYWTVMNLLTALQQWWVMRQDGDPAVVVVDSTPEKGRRK